MVPRADGYRFVVQPQRIDVLGGSPAGCFYALQTLAQLSELHGGVLPCCTIADWPDFAARGLLHDVSRGKVPTLATLKVLVDRLARLKINQLQLYIEHTFAFSFDTEICGPDDGLTPDEVRELDAYCSERFVDLVPALATLGHMGRILSMSKYRHLAEVEPAESWEHMSWPERLRGLTLDCANPEAHHLVKRMWSDVLDAFSSPVVNICGDEPWDLGRGKNRERFAACGKGRPYVEHIRRTHDICAARGRSTQFWSDVVRNHPDLLECLPGESTVLHWGYDDAADYEGTAMFVAAGLNTFVCPGTSGWKRIINAIDLAERNITAFADAGRRHGASGLLNTDWGDHGHFNMPACSRHGIALGAALGWRADHPTGRKFDEHFAQAVLRTDDVEGVCLLRKTSQIAERCETWRLLRMPLGSVRCDPSLPGRNEVTAARHFASEFRRWCERANPLHAVDRDDLAELALAARFTELFADKALFAHQDRNTSGEAGATEGDRAAWAEELREAARAFADRWLACNKHSGLDDVLKALLLAAQNVCAA